jgi:SAM-dependent methyltransferase
MAANVLVGRWRRYETDSCLKQTRKAGINTKSTLIKTFNLTDPAGMTRTAHVKRYLELFKNGDVEAALDVGCGEGRYVNTIIELWPDAAVTGIDADEGALETARRKGARHASDKVKFFLCDAEEGLPDGPYDLIICIEVLEHIVQDDLLLHNASRALKNGGLLILHTPSVEQKRYFGINVNNRDHSGGGKFGHVRDGYNRTDLLNKIDKAGLTVVGSRSTFGPFAASVSDLDFALAKRKLDPARVLTYVCGLIASRIEVNSSVTKGRGIIVAARK